MDKELYADSRGNCTNGLKQRIGAWNVDFCDWRKV